MGKLNTVKNGKGDKYRKVNLSLFELNWDDICWKSKTKLDKLNKNIRKK